ncbi:alpha- and gamma-adaptin-binding protein p34 isoform X2 [Parasteatoda tepidariorum]|uniref:alpha- and gamma-adaptin-binding protein p34 isoform X2 n=1 Tax=Parasteatoda tepidariorum TaxID=114398 RepID=UPI001C72151B|nr:alpha- and gamma-adaptin-binding protein p34 isoform X2 [Parasteatoda tepidariorum]
MNSSTMNEYEGVVVISCDPQNEPAQNIIFRILGKEAEPSATNFSNIKGYLWNVETKYYTAEVFLYAIEQQEKLEPKFCESVKAIIFYIDSTETTSFNDVKNWMPYLQEMEANVQLLICNNSHEESKGRKSVLNWCVQNQFELVELNSSADEEDDFTADDAKGFDRVIQSLQSHLWANLNMKDEKLQIKSTDNGDSKDTSDEKLQIKGTDNGDSKEISGPQEKDSSDIGDASTASNVVDSTVKKESKKSSTKVKVENDDLDLDEQLLSDVLSGEDPGGESFEALFDKFASMKDRAAGLNGEDRKKYAEKVAIAFWRAMGGDEDEIEGLDDD